MGYKNKVSPLILQSWLDVLCQTLPNVSSAIVSQIERDACLPPAVCWPADAAPEHGLLVAAEAALQQACPVIQANNFAHPLTVEGRLVAVVAVAVVVTDQQRAIVQQLLEWGEQWLHLVIKSSADAGSGSAVVTTDTVTADATAALVVLDVVLHTAPLPAAVLALVNQLATQFSCERVLLGLQRGKHMRVQGVSHGLEFDPRTEMIRAIEAAMDELGAGGPVSGEEMMRIVERHGIAAEGQVVCAIPLSGVQGVMGVLWCQRDSGREFTGEERQSLQALAGLLGPVLELRQDRSRSWWRSSGLLAGSLDRLLGPGHRGFKLSIAVSVALLGLLVFAPASYRVNADASVEGLIQRAVVAPFDGYIAEALVRAGDTVAAGAVIARLDDRELVLELGKSASEEAKLDKEYRKALASLERSEARIVQSQLAQVQAHSQLLQQKLDRIQLTSPLAGVILSGDLSRSLGAPVERGQVLFEVAPLKAYRLVLQVDERDVAQLALGQRGQLTLTALPQQQWSFVVEQISPVFTELDTGVSYRTEARIEGEVDRLRPGMEGVGKIEVGQRSLGWILFHKAWDWLRLQVWLWLP